MAMRFLQHSGRTSSLYSALWRSKASMQGIETTRVAGSFSPAFRASWSSEPVAIMIFSSFSVSFFAMYAPLSVPSALIGVPSTLSESLGLMEALLEEGSVDKMGSAKSMSVILKPLSGF